MTENEIVILDLMKKLREACRKEDWPLVKDLCADLKDYTHELNQLDRERLIYYYRRTKDVQ